MRLQHLALFALLTATGCASITTSDAQPAADGADVRAARPAPDAPPRPRESAGPGTVGASELRTLAITRATSLRQEPTAGAPRFGALEVGDLVLRLDARGPWFRVWVPSVAMSGWIEKGSAGRGPAAPAAAAAPVPVTELAMVTVSKRGARLRGGPSTRARIVRSLERGEPLRLLRQEGAWLKVFDPATKGTGYISTRLVERGR